MAPHLPAPRFAAQRLLLPASMRAQRRLSQSLLTGAVSLLALLALDAHNITRAEPVGAQAAVATLSAEIFGVGRGAGVREVSAAAAHAGVTCVQSGETSIVCPAELAASPVSSIETLWLKGGVVDRVYLVANVGDSASFAVHERAFGLLAAWVTRHLGQPAVPVRPPAWWSSPAVNDERKMLDLASQRARLEISWFVGDTTVRLWLAGEGGQVRLVLGMWREEAAAVDCSPAALNDALLNLFPPAADSDRAAAAQRLAACRVTRAAGALGAALDLDLAPEVQAQALRALDGLGAAPSTQSLDRLAAKAPPALADVAR